MRKMPDAAGAAALVAEAVWVGHSGGQLVYRRGAASACTGTASSAPDGTVPTCEAAATERDRD